MLKGKWGGQALQLSNGIIMQVLQRGSEEGRGLVNARAATSTGSHDSETGGGGGGGVSQGEVACISKKSVPGPVEGPGSGGVTRGRQRGYYAFVPAKKEGYHKGIGATRYHKRSLNTGEGGAKKNGIPGSHRDREGRQGEKKWGRGTGGNHWIRLKLPGGV